MESSGKELGNLDNLLTKIREPDYGTKEYLKAIARIKGNIAIRLADDDYTVIETTVPQNAQLGSEYDEILRPRKGHAISIVLRDKKLGGIKREHKGYLKVYRINEPIASYGVDPEQLNLLSPNYPIVQETVHMSFTRNGDIREANYMNSLIENAEEKQQIKTFLEIGSEWAGGMFELMYYPPSNWSRLRLSFIDDDNKPTMIDISDRGAEFGSTATLYDVGGFQGKQILEITFPFEYQGITYSLDKDPDGQMRFSIETPEKRVEARFPETITIEQARQFANRLKTDEWINDVKPFLSIGQSSNNQKNPVARQ